MRRINRTRVTFDRVLASCCFERRRGSFRTTRATRKSKVLAINGISHVDGLQGMPNESCLRC